jgi:hypothetical protein
MRFIGMSTTKKKTSSKPKKPNHDKKKSEQETRDRVDPMKKFPTGLVEQDRLAPGQTSY